MLSDFVEKNTVRLIELIRDSFFSAQEKPDSDSIYIGEAQSLFDRNKTDKIYLSLADKESHMYIVGGTGVGKSTFLEHIIRKHIIANEGFALFDIDGNISEQIIRFMASVFQNKSDNEKQIIGQKLILVEPANLQEIIGFNPLGVQKSETVYSTVLELVQIFRTRWADSWGPRTNELLRNVLIILAENNLTLMEASSLLLDQRFRNSLIIQNQEAKTWLYRYNKLTEPQKTVYREPSLNKIGEFLGDISIRYLIGQEKSSFTLREVMDKQKFLILNLSKAKLKSNAFLLAGLFLAKLQTGSLTRVDTPYSLRKSFFAYLDEFQNFVSEEISDMETILCEARKYKIFLRMSHQNVYQLDRKLVEAILGNSKVMSIFRVNHSDALTLAQELNPSGKEFLNRKLTDLGVGEAYFKIKGQQHRLVKLPLPPEVKVDDKTIAELKQLSLFNHARPLAEVEKEIHERHKRLGLIKGASANTAGSAGGAAHGW